MSGVASATPPELLGSRRSRLLGSVRPSGAAVALLSTVAVFGLIGYIVVSSPGWQVVQRDFFSSHYFDLSFPHIVRALWKNIQLFLLAEIFILVFALVLAVMRSLPGPAFFPLRLIAVAYIDLFRGLPSILVL